MSPSQMAERLAGKVEAHAHLPEQAEQGVARRAAMVEEIEHMFLHYEFKILRLTEFLYEAIRNGAFGPVNVPNTVGVDGLPIRTPVGEIRDAFRDIYDLDMLDGFDEEGNPIG
jgi:hypothetical protein